MPSGSTFDFWVYVFLKDSGGVSGIVTGDSVQELHDEWDGKGKTYTLELLIDGDPYNVIFKTADILRIDYQETT